MIADCAKFQLDNRWALINAVLADSDADTERAGMNFWLTRNGHGSGFWDGDWGDWGDELTDASKAFGECDLYVGDDGMLYLA